MSKVVRVSVYFLLVVVIVSTAVRFWYTSYRLPHKRLPELFYNKNQIIAHNGCGDDYPENILEVLDIAVNKHHATIIELDLRISKDEQLIVFHDFTLDKLTNGTGAVSDYTVKELKTFDAAKNWKDFSGAKIPTLEEALEWSQRHPDILLVIELKANASRITIEQLAKTFSKHRFLYERAVVFSYETWTLRKLRLIDPELSLIHI
eukprot:TRINITY_DN2825_c0_g1_i1.p1 TRINITY_DN2825_c0_g1~~TRINITY_DN2825_c0_g1_i1.p1  ORF type:complete len:205 (-),score=30.27 TRINITY_DN2825_c0_g1_i1:50-664(-)